MLGLKLNHVNKKYRRARKSYIPDSVRSVPIDPIDRESAVGQVIAPNKW